MSVDAITLRPAHQGDRFLIRRWLAEPGATRWWGTAARAEAEITLALASPSALCRIVLAGAAPAGYVQAVDATLWGSGLPPDLPPGTYDVDLVVAAAPTAADMARTALRLLADEVFTTTFAAACAVFPPVADEAATRIFEKAGFRWQRVWADPVDGPAWLMLKRRP